MNLELPFLEREINGTEYRAQMLHIDKWEELTELIGGTLGDPIASLLRGDSVMDSADGAGFSRGDIVSIIGMLVKKLNAKTMKKLREMIAQCVLENGKPLGMKKQDIWWPRHMKDYIPVVILFLEVQYGDFLEGLLGSIKSDPSEEVDLSENTKEQ